MFYLSKACFVRGVKNEKEESNQNIKKEVAPKAGILT